VSAYIAALLKARVTLIEKHRMGGDCLNTGCVPSKALLRCAGVRHLFSRAQEFGLHSAGTRVDFPAVMQRVRKVIGSIEPHDSVARYEQLGVDCVHGVATITSPYTVEVDGRTITTRNIVLATGARPSIPEISGVQDMGCLTSETIWNLKELPPRLLVLGGGPIGCELAQAFARLGSHVTLLTRSPRLLPREDEEVSALLEKNFLAEGIVVHTSCRITAFRREGARKLAFAAQDGVTRECEFDEVLVAVGRRPNTEGLGLEQLGVELDARGAPVVNEYLQTTCPNIFVCGDLAGPYQFTHMAAFQAWYASVNALFRGFRKFRVDYRVVPWATFTDPEIARVGLNESEARAQGIACEVSRFGIDDLDRAIADGENHGFIKVLTVPGSDRILGVTIAAYHASELLTEFTLAMTHGLGLKKILGTIHVYPTLSESNKYVAGVWRRQHAPKWLYPWLERFHRWRRG
jgi:pyruvate/2-oxoglutarate dehydrogenase complex dihydrolipoamide dehydrogenase (E3) component